MVELPKITLSEMRESGVRGLLVYCSDIFKCSHWVRLSAEDCDRWLNDVRLSDSRTAVRVHCLRPTRSRG